MRANRARTNVGEVLRGNEGARRLTDLAKTEPRSRPNGRRSVNRVLCEVGVFKCRFSAFSKSRIIFLDNYLIQLKFH